ncbi:Mg(2+) transport ATPase, P-type [Methylopila sp. Yamaguchi]|nr:Mg(2+) transport ATPase, P-type [Methylopila sp. Yamaguchi]
MSKTSAAAEPDPPFWTKRLDSTLTRLAATASGLSTTEAARRIDLYGPNEARAQVRSRVLGKVVTRLSQPLVALLLIAGVLAGALGDVSSSAIIAGVVVMSITLEIWQEHKAETAAEELKSSVALNAAVLRDGTLQRIAVNRLVPGDVVELRAGDLTPADGLIISAQNILVDEAALTGEPYPVHKRPGSNMASSIGDAVNALFAGSIVISGSSRMVVAKTGAATVFGGVAEALSSDELPTTLDRGLGELGRLLIKMTLFLSFFVVLAQLTAHRPALEAFLFALALAVGLTPELLPMVTTVTLSRGAVRMAKRGVVAKKLSAIHDLGALNVLCTDKTGTLTDARVALTSYVNAEGATSAEVLVLAGLNASLTTGARSPLDDAIAAVAPPPTNACLIAEAPFDFERRRASVLVDRTGNG